MFNNKKVSQERIIGISFVDILIQAVFLLLLLLMIGYIDPDDPKYIYYEAGKDLCAKIDKESPQACVEYVRQKEFGIKEATANKLEPAKDFCARRGLLPEECKETLDQMSSNANFWPCIRPPSDRQVQFVASTSWLIHSPDEIEFKGFTPDYVQYLNTNKFTEKISQVNQIKSSGPKFFTASEVEIGSAFSFILEENCFHHTQINWSGKYNSADLLNAFRSINSLKKFAK